MPALRGTREASRADGANWKRAKCNWNWPNVYLAGLRWPPYVGRLRATPPEFNSVGLVKFTGRQLLDVTLSARRRRRRRRLPQVSWRSPPASFSRPSLRHLAALT